jgi:hypothetical protein
MWSTNTLLSTRMRELHTFKKSDALNQRSIELVLLDYKEPSVFGPTWTAHQIW